MIRRELMLIHPKVFSKDRVGQPMVAFLEPFPLRRRVTQRIDYFPFKCFFAELLWHARWCF